MWNSKTLYFVYLLRCWRTLGLLPCFGYREIGLLWTCVVTSFSYPVFSSFGYVTRRETLDPLAFHVLIFWRTTILVSMVAEPSHSPTNNAPGLPFLHVLDNTCYVLSFDDIILMSWCVILWLCAPNPNQFYFLKVWKMRFVTHTSPLMICICSSL